MCDVKSFHFVILYESAEQLAPLYKEFGIELNIDYRVYISEIKWYSNSALIYLEFLCGSQRLCSRCVKCVISDFSCLYLPLVA